MTWDEWIARAEKALSDAIAERDVEQASLLDLRDKLAAGDETITREDIAKVTARLDAADVKVREATVARDEAVAEQARDAEIAELRKQIVPTEVRAPKYDQVARVGAEERTYRADQDPQGKQFLRDLLARDMGNSYDARSRLERHMAEEKVERAGQVFERAATGTGAFAGLVVPQYLTDLYAPKARAGRPFADACRHHDMPEDGMTVNLSRITTGTTTAVQTEGSAVSETDIDDTLLSIPVQTNAGSQTLTRQSVERGTAVQDVTLEDLFSDYATKLDSTLLNQATNGLTNVATSIAYTDASPTAAELYPKVFQAIAAVEAALLNQDPNGTAVVMHSRRWYWMQSQLSSTFPLFGQPGVGGINVAGTNYGVGYGSPFRGVLPSGTPVVVDNNIATNYGGGTNEDEIYFVSLPECHLWEDPNAPMLIRTETGPSVKSLGIDIVVYGYFAYTHARQAHTQKIGGTGLVTPAWA